MVVCIRPVSSPAPGAVQRALAEAEDRLREVDSSRASLEAQLRAAHLQASTAVQARPSKTETGLENIFLSRAFMIISWRFW